jgi:hypothetical protein
MSGEMISLVDVWFNVVQSVSDEFSNDCSAWFGFIVDGCPLRLLENRYDIAYNIASSSYYLLHDVLIIGDVANVMIVAMVNFLHFVKSWCVGGRLHG